MATILGKLLEGRWPVVKVRISNAVRRYEFDDVEAAPAVERSIDVWALIDTGATASALGQSAQASLDLPQQGSRPVLFPNMTCAEFHPSYCCALEFFEHYSAGAPRREWPDWPELLCFDLGGRRFDAVLGMDVLSALRLTLVAGAPSLAF